MVAPDSLTDTPMDTNAEKGAANNIPSQSTRNEETTDEKEPLTEEVHKQPSYVALACCISGYTTLSYDSKQRQSLRSRPVSPVRPDSIQNVMFTSEGGKYLLPEPVKINQNMQTEGKEKLAVEAEKELTELDNEEGCGILRAAAGKARLLVAQKLKQFEGLCLKNIKQSDKEDFPTTNEDLAGFWDMVMIQVNEVVSQFEQINKLRKNDWKNIEETLIAESNRTATTNLQTPNKMQTPRKLATKKTPTSDNSKESSSSSSKARDEARRKMIEERRKAMKEKRQNLDTSVGFAPVHIV
uniref:Uncharacterized protein n=1 Tax=Rhodnius prolixus TaxID=13249 RepID=T1IAF6_RHOPR